jgi:hypothetical protein
MLDEKLGMRSGNMETVSIGVNRNASQSPHVQIHYMTQEIVTCAADT